MLSNRFVYASLDAWKPCGTGRYLYLPHSVMKVVESRTSGARGTLWYLFHASKTVYLFCDGMTLPMLKGLCV